MANKLTQSEFLEKIQGVHGDKYNYTKSIYQGSHSDILIECFKHGEFTLKAGSFLRGQICPKCEIDARKQSFIDAANSIHKNKYDYSKVNYTTNKIPVVIICSEHGEFFQAAGDHLKGYGCSKCSGKYKPNTKEWIKKAQEIHDNRYDYSKVNYIDNKIPVEVICQIHGSFYPIPNNHILHQSGCPKCNDVSKSLLYRKTTEQFIIDAINVHGIYYNYDKVNYLNKIKKVIIICPIHGEFKQSPGGHLAGAGCPKCQLKNQTKLLNKLEKSFKDLEILWENSPSWLGRQRFDIYFSKYNIAVEYNGQQHYVPVKRFGGEIQFLKTKELDELKRQKCKDNDCVLFEVKYDYNENDYEELVNNINSIIKLKQTQNEN